MFTGDLEILAQFREDFGLLDENFGVLREVSADTTFAPTVETIIASLEEWQAEIARPQLEYFGQPSGQDIAMLLEGSPQNTMIWTLVERELDRVGAQVEQELDALSASLESNQFVLEQIGYVTGAAFIVAGLGLYLYFSRAIGRPLTQLAGVTEKLRQADWAVEVPGVDRSDEIGALAKGLASTRDAGREKEMRDKSRAAEAEQKAKEAVELRHAVARFEGEIASLLGEFDGAGSDLSSSAESLLAMVSDSQDYTRSVTDAAQATGSSVQNVASAVEEMSISIREISQQTQNVSQLTQDTSDSAQSAIGKVEGLKAMSEKIHDVIGLINGIAGQINLLALNATIESARAGEAGKGFAVVAQQVKQLADQTAKATEEITRVIGQVSDGVSDVVQAINGIGEAINDVSLNTAAVAAAVEEQSSALEEISNNVSNVSEQTSQVADSVDGVNAKVVETSATAGSITGLSHTVREGSTRLGEAVEGFVRSVPPPRMGADA
ncbi:MAG: methyl-accepting chemotaxis protein [Pseudomonadota bacterium]